MHPCNCNKIAATANLEASVVRINSDVKSGYASTGSVVSACLGLLNALSCRASHLKAESFLINSVSGLAISANFGICRQ
jgi:hypothetical protein